jgi:hypothetical protein
MGSEALYNLIALRAKQRSKLRLEPDLNRTWDEARYEYPDVRHSPEIVVREYFMYYAAGYVHPDEGSDAVLSRWLYNPRGR